ncbi:SDR family NAD(P)-dependent oxidoreductase [Haloarchaeobius salinus]|uniref:SDR family NAD(P)-dependent oxidoreductase n=1 Tax=Haloarchaeobius salinus TaxID=1198298 RepID=UPI00210E5B0D|nr:SDR family NAD(P)-dependent oxidoreductase [Haloarchaeobius salinus]
MDLGLDDRTALITGGAGRLGSEDARHLAQEGAEVVVLDVDEDGAERVVSEIEDDGGDAMAVTCDLTDREDVRESVAEVREATGGVDILVNNAGFVDAVSRTGDFPDELWDRDVELNLTGAYNITKEIFPAMRERGWGRVITMASIAGTHGSFGQLSYSTTKSGLVGFGKTLALEGATDGVTSNVLAPSIVVKELAEMDPETLEQFQPSFERVRQATPMGELGREDDVAPMVCYLASEQARYVTGQVIGITGGADLLST